MASEDPHQGLAPIVNWKTSFLPAGTPVCQVQGYLPACRLHVYVARANLRTADRQPTAPGRDCQLRKSVALPACHPADSVTCGDLDGLLVNDREYPRAPFPLGHAAGTAGPAYKDGFDRTRSSSMPSGPSDGGASLRPDQCLTVRVGSMTLLLDTRPTFHFQV